MSDTEIGWTFVDKGNGVVQGAAKGASLPIDASELCSSEEDTDQEFEVVKKGFAPSNFPLLRLAENHYGSSDACDDGSDIEVVKDDQVESGCIQTPSKDNTIEDFCIQDCPIDEDDHTLGNGGEEDDWFTLGFQGDFDDDRNDSDEEDDYGLVELFQSGASGGHNSVGVLCDSDWQPRSRTSPVLLIVLLGVSTGILLIGNSSVIETGDDASSGQQQYWKLDVILLSARLNASVEKFDRLRMMYADLERSHAASQERLKFAHHFTTLWRNRTAKHKEYVRVLERLVASQRMDLYSCRETYKDLLARNWSSSAHSPCDAVPSLRNCVTVVMEALPTVNISAIFPRDSSTERFLHKMAARVATAKVKVNHRISTLNKKFMSTWKQLAERWRGHKSADSKSEDAQPKRTKKNFRDAYHVDRFRKLFKMSNIVGSPAEVRQREVVTEKGYCHLKAGAAKARQEFRLRWKNPTDQESLSYPLPMQMPAGSDFVSSRPEQKNAVDCTQPEDAAAITGTQSDHHDDDGEATNVTRTTIDELKTELEAERGKLMDEREKFERWRELETRKIEKARAKAQRQNAARVERSKSYAAKLHGLYERKMKRARRKLKRKKAKLELKLKDLRELLTTLLQRRLDDLRDSNHTNPSSQDGKINKDRLHQLRLVIAQKEAEIKRHEHLVTKCAVKYHELETRIDVLQRLHKNLRSKYATLKEKHSQNYHDMVFDIASSKKRPLADDIPTLDLELEDWVPTISCPDQDGCQGSHTPPAKEESKSNFPGVLCRPQDSCSSQKHSAVILLPTAIARTPNPAPSRRLKNITPSPPTRRYDFSHFEPTVAFTRNLSSAFAANSITKSFKSPMSSVAKKNRGDWYFDLMQSRANQRAVPMSWYLYWAQGREESRSQSSNHHLRHPAGDWYTAMMRERSHLRRMTNTWYYDWMKGRDATRSKHGHRHHHSRTASGSGRNGYY